MTYTAHTSASRTLREIASWQPVKGSADNDLLPELSTIVARSRDLARNHGVAGGTIQTLSDNIVGLGFRLSAKQDYKALGKTKEWEEEWQIKVESLWLSWSETFDCDTARKLTFNGLTTLVFKYCLINGEALALTLWSKDRKFNTCIQLVEPDRLSNPHDGFDTDKLRGENRYAYTRCKWIGPGRGLVDPVKEAQACQIRRDIGLSTLEAECASQGLDWEEVLEQRAREKSKLAELGLKGCVENENTIVSEEDKKVSGS